MILKVALLILMLLHVITFRSLIHGILGIQEQVRRMRNEYKDRLTSEIKVTGECFDKRGECVNAITEAVQLLDDVISEERTQE